MTETYYLRHGRLHYFVREALKRLRVPAPHASKVSDALVAAELAGVEGEGVSRLPFFGRRLSAGLIKPNPEIRVVTQDPATALIDGDNGLGPVVAVHCMETAIKKAKRFGIAAVGARNSNDFGMAGYYARMALAEQMIGIVMSNASPSVAAPGSDEPVLGSNPIAVAVPPPESRAPFILDMATSATSRPKLVSLARDGLPLAPGLARDHEGRPTSDPRVALEAMRLAPLGGTLETGGYKGFGLALAVEMLCGLLTGGSFGRELLRAEGTHQSVAGLGHFFIVIRVRSFSPWVKFHNRAKDLLAMLKAGSGKETPRYYPGEMEFEIEQDRRANGIALAPEVAAELEGLARRLDIYDAWEHLVEGKK